MGEYEPVPLHIKLLLEVVTLKLKVKALDREIAELKTQLAAREQVAP
jgi:hypothetical protein